MGLKKAKVLSSRRRPFRVQVRDAAVEYTRSSRLAIPKCHEFGISNRLQRIWSQPTEHATLRLLLSTGALAG